MINWEYLAISFIQQTGKNGGKKAEALHLCINILKRLTGAHIVVLVEQTGDTATVKYATAAYMLDMAMDIHKTSELLKTGKPFYKTGFEQRDNFLADIFPALLSAVAIPVSRGKQSYLLALGWSVKQDFDHSFAHFADVVQIRMRDMIACAALQQELTIMTEKYNSIVKE